MGPISSGAPLQLPTFPAIFCKLGRVSVADKLGLCTGPKTSPTFLEETHSHAAEPANSEGRYCLAEIDYALAGNLKLAILSSLCEQMSLKRPLENKQLSTAPGPKGPWDWRGHGGLGHDGN